jgi:hypothetical protein
MTEVYSKKTEYNCLLNHHKDLNRKHEAYDKGLNVTKSMGQSFLGGGGLNMEHEIQSPDLDITKGDSI